MSKVTLAIIAASLSLSANVYAADNGDLPEISGYDDAAYYPLPDVVSSDFDGLTTEVNAAELPEATESADSGGLPEISPTDDEVYQALPALVPNI